MDRAIRKGHLTLEFVGPVDSFFQKSCRKIFRPLVLSIFEHLYEKKGALHVSAVEQALLKLNQKVGQLESAMTSLESGMTGSQRDMFGSVPQNGQAVNPAVVAQKLDSAIETIENVLNEGEA